MPSPERLSQRAAARAGRELLLDPKTLASWARRLDDQVPSALLASRKPVNAFDDATTDLIHRLHSAAPTLGRRPLANVLLRIGLRLAASTVRRRLRGPRARPPTATPVEPESTPSDEVPAASNALVGDRGTQFRTEYLEWCRRRDARPRFGAVGRHGSVAVIERFILPLKQDLLWRVHVPVRHDAMAALVAD